MVNRESATRILLTIVCLFLTFLGGRHTSGFSWSSVTRSLSLSSDGGTTAHDNRSTNPTTVAPLSVATASPEEEPPRASSRSPRIATVERTVESPLSTPAEPIEPTVPARASPRRVHPRPVPALQSVFQTAKEKLAVMAAAPLSTPLDSFFMEETQKLLDVGKISQSRFDVCFWSCKAPECWSNSLGQCMPNPFFVEASSPSQVRTPQPLECLHRGAEFEITERPPLPSDLKSWQNKLQAFKHYTAATVSYVPWGGTCTQYVSPRAPPMKLTARHDGTNKYYRIRNFCLSPVGPMFGEKPVVGEFLGRDEMFNMRPGEEWFVKPFSAWLKNTVTLKKVDKVEMPVPRLAVDGEAAGDTPTNATTSIIESSPDPRTCFLDTKLLIVPVGPRSGNPVHVWHRLAMLNHIMEDLWPGVTKEHNRKAPNVVTVFVFPTDAVNVWDSQIHTVNNKYLNETGFYQYLRLVTGAHFVIYGSVRGEFSSLLNPPTGEDGKPVFSTQEVFGQPLACFQEAVVYQNCFKSDCQNSKGIKPLVTPTYPLFHRRTPAVQDSILAKTRLCLDLPQRLTARSTNPKVLLSLRSLSRRWPSAPYTIARLALHVKRELKGTLAVHEMGYKHSNVADWIRLYADMDVMLAGYGSGQFFAMMMPKGGVAIEINSHCATDAGIDKTYNHRCEYGGDNSISEVHHIAVPLGSFVHARAGLFPPDFDIAPLTSVGLVTMAECVRSADRQAGQLGEQRSTELSNVEKIQKAQHINECWKAPDQTWQNSWMSQDPTGFYFRLLARTGAPLAFAKPRPASRQYSRIPWLIENFYPEGKPVVQIGTGPLVPRRQASVLVVVPCDFTSMILEEIDVFLDYGAIVGVYMVPLLERDQGLCARMEKGESDDVDLGRQQKEPRMTLPERWDMAPRNLHFCEASGMPPIKTPSLFTTKQSHPPPTRSPPRTQRKVEPEGEEADFTRRPAAVLQGRAGRARGIRPHVMLPNTDGEPLAEGPAEEKKDTEGDSSPQAERSGPSPEVLQREADTRVKKATHAKWAGRIGTENQGENPVAASPPSPAAQTFTEAPSIVIAAKRDSGERVNAKPNRNSGGGRAPPVARAADFMKGGKMDLDAHDDEQGDAAPQRRGFDVQGARSDPSAGRGGRGATLPVVAKKAGTKGGGALCTSYDLVLSYSKSSGFIKKVSTREKLIGFVKIGPSFRERLVHVPFDGTGRKDHIDEGPQVGAPPSPRRSRSRATLAPPPPQDGPEGGALAPERDTTKED